MPVALDVLTREAMALPPEQRIAFARQLLDVTDENVELAAEAAWEQEITRRIGKLDARETDTIPAGKFFAELRRFSSEQCQP